MRVKDYDYELPLDLIAREPREHNGERRSDSRLIVMDRQKNTVSHKKFKDIEFYMDAGDVLVLNNSKTIKANLVGTYNTQRKIEIDLCGMCDNGVWLCFVQFDNNINVGGRVAFSKNEMKLTGVVVEKIANNVWAIKFDQSNVIDIANEIGRPIISHYFKERFDIELLQNTYSTVYGSSELPAAGRHFDKELLEKISNKGVSIVFVTLHTGLSSINVNTENFEDFQMHNENIEITEDVADTINKAKKNHKKIIATGTTVVRTLESCVDDNGFVKPYKGPTNLYIYEGFKFKVVDKFITNFHAPRSTRIAMAAAFSGKELLSRCYREAIDKKYLFYEFGDATLTI